MVQIRHTKIREGNTRSKDAVWHLYDSPNTKIKEQNFHWIIKSISVDQSLEVYASYACLDKSLNLTTYRGQY